MMELLIILAGPLYVGLGFYIKDWLMFWFGVIYTGLFVVAYFLRRYNHKRAHMEMRRKQNQLLEQHFDQHIDR